MVLNTSHIHLSDLPRILDQQRTAKRITLQTTLPGRYAKALFSKLLEDAVLKPGRSLYKQGQEFLTHIQNLIQTLDAHPSLKTALFQPTIPLDRRLSLVDAVLTRLESPIILHDFIRMLMRHKRLAYLDAIYDCLDMMIQHEAHYIPMTFVTATKSTAKILKDTHGFLRELFDHAHPGMNKPVTLNIDSRTDPHLIAGYRIELSEYVIDASFAHQLVLIRTHVQGGQRA